MLRTKSALALGLMLGTMAMAAQQPNAAPEPKVKMGDVAPDFTLKDHNRQDVKLSQFRGKQNVVLAFYVFAFTGG